MNSKELRELIARRVAWGWIFNEPDLDIDFKWKQIDEGRRINAFKVADQIINDILKPNCYLKTEGELPKNPYPWMLEKKLAYMKAQNDMVTAGFDQ